MFLSMTPLTRGLLCSATLGLLAVASAPAQTVVAGFEGGTPFAPGGGVTIGRFGDNGTQTVAYGIAPTEGVAAALLTTFGNGTGNYPTGSPVFGASGSQASSALWGSMFPGSSTNALSALNLVAGSALTVTLTLAVGDTVSFDWNFLTSEPNSGGNADSGFVAIRLGTTGNPATFSPLGSVAAATTPTPGAVPHFDAMTGFSTFAFVAPTAGSYTFGIGVADAGAEAIQSGLLLDNFRVTPIPEPATLALVAGGIGLLGLLRRRRA